jgi:membrane associated rhomboid family serine protease
MAVYRIDSGANPKSKSLWNSISLTTKLIVINVIAFIAFSLLSLLDVLPLEYVALNPAYIFEKYYLWTFITSMFMHGGIFHLFVNMLSLYFVGTLVERILGKKRYFWFYMIAGIFAGILFVSLALVFPADYNAFAVGASGALFGVIGVLVFLTPNLPVYAMFIPIPIKMKYAAPGMLVLLWVISIGAGIPIGNVAHLGGLLAGVAYGLYLRYAFPNKIKFIQRKFS